MQKMKLTSFVMAGIVALMVAGCAKPPVAEMTAAQAAKDAAITAQAETYAMAAMEEAKRVWSEAEVKMQQKAYQEAKLAFEAAKVAFEKAASEVEAGKKAIVDENTAAVTALEAAFTELSKAAGKKVKKLQADAKKTFETDNQMIQEGLKIAKDATSAPVDVKKKLAEVKIVIEKWVETFKSSK